MLKEISEPAGAEIYISRLPIADRPGAQGSFGVRSTKRTTRCSSAQSTKSSSPRYARENMPFAFLGEITGGRIVAHDERDGTTPVDLDLEDVLGKMPKKTFHSNHTNLPNKSAVALPAGTNVGTALDRVLRLLSVGSKRFLTNKVDRSVKGLSAQQQCVGPLHTPLADCAVLAQSHFPNSEGKYTGVVTSIGEQPIKGLLCPKAQARMTLGEMLTNIVGKVHETGAHQVQLELMYAAKLPGEGALMYDVAKGQDAMLEIGVAIDGQGLSLDGRKCQRRGRQVPWAALSIFVRNVPGRDFHGDTRFEAFGGLHLFCESLG